MEEKNHLVDTLSYEQLMNETRAAFTFVDTLYNGWLTLPDSLKKIDTIPAVFFKAKKRITRTESKRLYNFLVVRLVKDTLLLYEIKK